MAAWSPRQWLLVGKLHRDAERQLMAENRLFADRT
jgi:hypothetical protein